MSEKGPTKSAQPSESPEKKPAVTWGQLAQTQTNLDGIETLVRRLIVNRCPVLRICTLHEVHGGRKRLRGASRGENPQPPVMCGREEVTLSPEMCPNGFL